MTDVPPRPQDQSEEDHRHGHRQRLRERFARVGTDGLQDYELLELVLFRSIPQRDVKPLAKLLISQFGSVAEVIGAPMPRLLSVKGLGEQTALDIKIIEVAGLTLAKGAVTKREVLSSWSSVIEYCRAAMAFAEVEQFRILFLDKRNGLLADELQQTGTVDHTPVYPREIMKRALEHGASAVILVHNHPSGDPTPSRADIEITREVAKAAQTLGVQLHDHLIIARSGHMSFKSQGLL